MFYKKIHYKFDPYRKETYAQTEKIKTAGKTEKSQNYFLTTIALVLRQIYLRHHAPLKL